MGFYRRFGKRALDLLLCGAGLAVLSPVFAALALLVRLDSPGPVFFAQKRIGKDHKTFQLYKFRSMRVDTPHDVPTHLLGDPTAYLTSIGKFLRKTSLDELPQLLNILRGEMSLVGPRPALWNQADLIALRDQNGASAVLPGLTGLAQVSGRDELPLAEKARLDGVYAARLSLRMDVACLIRTVVPVLHGEGVALDGESARHGAPPVDKQC